MQRIRHAEPKDVDRLVELLALLFAIEKDFAVDDEKQRRGLAMLLADDRGCIMVADENGTAVGMCSGQLTISTAEGGPALLIEDLVVAPEWRGHGLGRRLLDAVVGWGAARGAHRQQLLADRSNRAGLDFYENVDFLPTQLVCLRRRSGGSR
ncbi:MAG: GNAT family N-acetyltransferase [Thermodesulfobacteriota bacterium]